MKVIKSVRSPKTMRNYEEKKKKKESIIREMKNICLPIH